MNYKNNGLHFHLLNCLKTIDERNYGKFFIFCQIILEKYKTVFDCV